MIATPATHTIDGGMAVISVGVVTHHIPEVAGAFAILWYGMQAVTWIVNRGWKRRDS